MATAGGGMQRDIGPTAGGGMQRDGGPTTGGSMQRMKGLLLVVVCSVI